MKRIILQKLKDSIEVKQKAIESNIDNIIKAAEWISGCLSSGHKILIFGNGGSAADAQHIAAELVNRFEVERSPFAAIALTTDTSILTSIANDYDFSDIFAKQIRALGKSDDIVWGISTSGNSKNVTQAIDTAKQMNLLTIGMTGSGGKLATLSDLTFIVDSDVTARIQETHITLSHILCDLVDRLLFPEKFV